MDKIVYGNIIAQKVKDQIKEEIDKITETGKRLPHLVVILVGDDVGSKSYVAGKEKASIAVGMQNSTLRYDASISETELIQVVQELNYDSNVDGILVQLPLPSHINTNRVLFSINPDKDVDGFHPYNIGKMVIGEETFLPCTPKGIIKILEEIGYHDLSGKKAMVIGRSNIVGKPIAQLLLNKNATVTIAHSRTKDIEKATREMDIIIAAVGVPKMVKGNWIKEGAVVIDVGVNRDENGKLCGDVDFDDCIDKVKYITPVPKGVGPMTIAMLLENTLESYRKREGESNGV
ncbi:methylenetetrahydrofolate dehydrogenase (NADP+)/methenyltetrahydrofolate cyclohydrolase [Breznakia sp. PF5-3]|uniref:bifunctional methylenetetrahydrofolate dehydrogenase/methenyltetrahydrofolate cyclohydrolase FolD n=1 Tax=unclassified Breznakia TaxID=2623764 RepID=UPI0024074BFD|nr:MULTISPECIES: bifunctional methylenetetrahydrofolate dehydrogenase/methenyltetrahydrofolate cyclohydrolase FolD [unclassified Breznakia]MDF9825256.1 methylenetetrahydrofolate dehydrogenase (NADP+)/methenyltetrahydrofolate cyclohydrolase [Breznakia sp. PM6-1]MDF9836154.1 methylenetetrahydrofolate dehydrogenase (NADP+)/methenyltetrahydrofolate cyclohydrolase [Breznakia sp. PF5-3]MDF9838159.1 methylenetetrahydrofolate dehydrogenase (NADP+)/methenyltetrahydrofolate cyclohydrolase [Breznakia sp. P